MENIKNTEFIKEFPILFLQEDTNCSYTPITNPISIALKRDWQIEKLYVGQSYFFFVLPFEKEGKIYCGKIPDYAVDAILEWRQTKKLKSQQVLLKGLDIEGFLYAKGFKPWNYNQEGRLLEMLQDFKKDKVGLCRLYIEIRLALRANEQVKEYLFN